MLEVKLIHLVVGIYDIKNSYLLLKKIFCISLMKVSYITT